MAKNKDQAAVKLPKRIAGVKVPKSVRSGGEKLVDALSHPLIADIAAAALLAAAAALRDDKGVRRSAAKAKDGAEKGVKELGREASVLRSSLAGLAEAASASVGAGKGVKKKGGKKSKAKSGT